MNKLLCFIVLTLSLISYPLPALTDKTDSIEEMFKIIGIDEQMNGGFEAMLPIVDQLAAQLQLDESAKEELKNIYRDWFNNDIDRVSMKKKMIELYSEVFTEKEINELIVFYRSRVGQKFIKKSPELMKLGAQLGMQEAQSKQHLLLNRLQPFLDKHKN